MIEARFRSVVEDFVIGCTQITKFRCPRYCSPVRLLQGALVILVRLQTSQFRFFGSEYKYCVSFMPLL